MKRNSFLQHIRKDASQNKTHWGGHNPDFFKVYDLVDSYREKTQANKEIISLSIDAGDFITALNFIKKLIELERVEIIRRHT